MAFFSVEDFSCDIMLRGSHDCLVVCEFFSIVVYYILMPSPELVHLGNEAVLGSGNRSSLVIIRTGSQVLSMMMWDSICKSLPRNLFHVKGSVCSDHAFLCNGPLTFAIEKCASLMVKRSLINLHQKSRIKF